MNLEVFVPGMLETKVTAKLAARAVIIVKTTTLKLSLSSSLRLCHHYPTTL